MLGCLRELDPESGFANIKIINYVLPNTFAKEL